MKLSLACGKALKCCAVRRFEIKIVKKATNGHAVSVLLVAGKQVAGNIVDYARKVAASRQRSLKLAHIAKIVTKSGQLSAHYYK
jgi:hypothetical protein